jgi:hypothetical protein
MTLLVLRLYSVSGSVINEYGAVGGMKIGRGNWSTQRKSAPVPFCPPQMQHWHMMYLNVTVVTELDLFLYSCSK